MKRLNLNNTIATTAMLTKTNTMKNKINFFAKVVILVVMMVTLLPDVTWGQQPWTQTGGTWYILYVPEKDISGNKSWSMWHEDWSGESHTVYTPSVQPTNSIYSATISEEADNWPNFIINYDGTNLSIQGNKNCGWRGSKFCAGWQNLQFTMPSGTKTVILSMARNGCTKQKYIRLSIPVPEHADVTNATLSEIDFGEVEAYKTVYHDIEFTSLFTSFMAKDGFTLTSSTTTPAGSNVFFTNSNVSEQKLSNICGNNSVYAEPNNTPLSGNANLVKGTDNKYYLRLYFKPTSSTANYTGNFYLKLGNNTVITIPVKGRGGKISPGLIWTENTDLNVGNSVVNPATVSPDNIVVTYSSADSSKIAVNGNTLIALATTEPNKVTITATTTAYGDYKSVTSTKDFMVTNKQIQSITWNQKFTNLKFGDSDIPLNAIATSEGTITYWVENNSTNVVTINNGILHIVGTGDVKIYAKQAGGTFAGYEWLEVETYKQVKVRAVGAACEECAIESNGEWSSALSEQKSYTYYVKSKNGLNAPTGDVLTFRCSADGSPYFKLHTYVDNIEVEEFHHTVTSYNDVRTIQLTGNNKKENIQSVKFKWESTWPGGLSASTVKISEVCLSQLSYLRRGTTTSHDFGNVQFGSSQDVYLENIAKFSALSSDIDARIVSEPGFTNASSFKIIDTDGAETDETSIDVDCSDFGNLAINLKFTPQELGNLSAKLMLIGYKGNQQETIYVELHGACFSTPSLEFNNDCFTDKPVFDANGNYYQQTLSVATNSGATPSYTLVNTPQDVAEINGNQLKIKKAGVDITVRAHLDASGYYYERNLDSTFRATTVSPTLAWKVNTLGTKAYKIGDEIEVKNLVSQLYSANDAAQYLGNITVSAKDASGAEMLESVTVGNINTAKVRVTKAGEIVSLTVSTPAVTNYFTAESQPITSGCGEFDKKSQSITWSPQTNLKVGDNVAHDATAATEISYASDNTEIISNDGHCNKAGYTTHKATAAETWEYHNAESEKNFHVDFADDFVMTFPQNVVVGNSVSTTFGMSSSFLPSGNYTVEVTGGSTEFSVGNGTIQKNDNEITVTFAPTAVTNGNDTEEKTSIITIHDADGQTYSFKVKATAEKKDAGLTLSYAGSTFAFSTITLSHTKNTGEAVTYSASIGNVEGDTYKFQSTEQVTITATTPANGVFKAGSKSLTFTPSPVTPKVTNWSGSFTDLTVSDSPYEFTTADWDVDETVSGQPDKEEWEDEVTIIYSSSNEDIAKINGNNLEFGKAGLAIITATINAGDNHNGATKGETRTVKVDFAETGVVCGPAYAGETPVTYDITDMIVPEGQLTLTDITNNINNYFSVDFSDNKIVVVYNPTVYIESCTTEITLTDAGNGEVYHLNVRGECQKHTPEIVWKSDVNTMALAYDETNLKAETDLIDAANSSNYQPIKFKSDNVNIVKILDENYAEVEWGIYLYPAVKGTVTIYAKSEETENHEEGTSQKQFTVIGEAKSKIVWNQNFLRIYNDEGSIDLTAEVQASSNSAPIAGATVTYHLLNVQNNVVTLSGNTLNITSGKTGTAQIYAEFAGNNDYIGCVSETLNIIVVAKVVGGCNAITYNDVTSGTTTYYFNKSKTSEGGPYFEVEKVEYNYYVKGDNGRFDISGKGATKTIKAKLGTKEHSIDGEGGANSLLIWQVEDSKPVSGPYTLIPNQGENPTSISFTGDIGVNGSYFKHIKVTPKSYYKENTTFANPFAGVDTKVDEETIKTINLGTYSNLSEYTIKLWDYEMNREYSEGEFSIIDGGDSDNYPNGCNDYGDWIITVKFKPKSGKPEKLHRCKIMITYTKGADGSGNNSYCGFEMEATASRYDQPNIIWNQNLSNLTSLSTKPTGDNWISGDPLELTARSGLSELDYYGTYIGVDEYEITAGTDVAEIVNDTSLSIKKAGQFTIKATHNGDDKYNPKDITRTVDIALASPTIELSHEGAAITENCTIPVTFNDPQYTISGKALYGDFEIYGYNVGGKIQLSSSVPDVVTIANGNQLQFLKSGDAVITATITEDDVVFGKTFTFNVHVDKAPAGLHWDVASNYTDDWMYVFDTKQMTAVAGNDDNEGEITYEVTSGDADIDANGNITPNKWENITVKATVAATDKYMADDITISFIPTIVTPEVTWENSNVSLTTDKSQTTYTIADNDLATVNAKFQIPMQPSVDKWVDGKEITYSVESDNGVITLQNGHTFTINKAGQATIMAKVIAGDNNNASSNNPTRKLKVDFDPSSPIYCGEAVVFGTCTTTVNLGDIMAIEGNITVSVQNNDEFKAYFHPEDNELIITYSPKSIKEPNPTEAIVAITDGNEVQYKLHVTGKALPYTPIFYVSQTKHDNWVFETTPNKAKSEIIYGYDNSSDIYWSNTDGIAIQEAATELAKVQLSLKDATDAEYVEIVDDGRNFRVKNAKVDSDEDFTVFIVASYPGLEGKMEPSSVEIPITITKTQYSLNWNRAEGFEIEIYQHNKPLTAPTQEPKGGESVITYSFSEEGIGTYDGTTFTLPDNPPYKSGKLIAIIASDKYAKGTSADLDIKVKKTEQTVTWAGDEIKDGFTTQKSTEEGIQLTAEAYRGSTTKTNANIRYQVTENSNCSGEGDLIRLDVNKAETPWITTLYYTGNGSGTVSIQAIAEETDEYNESKADDPSASPTVTFNITRADCAVNTWTVSDMRYGDRVTLNPTINEFTKATNYEYTLPSVTGTLETVGNVLDVKGVGTNLTISAKKLEDCWVNESASSTASNQFNIAKSEQEIEWDKTALGTLQGEAYHFTVLDNSAYQLATQAIDKLHTDAETTCLPLVEGKYVTANMTDNAPGGLSLVYSIVEQDVCKVGVDKIVSVDNEGKMHITGNGTGPVFVIASVDGRDYYENVSETITVVVDKATPTFTWNVPESNWNVTYGEAISPVEITTDGDGVIALSSSDTDVATIDNNGNITINGAGTTVITATLAEGCKYFAANETLTQTLTVNKAATSFTITKLELTYGDEDMAFSVTNDNGLTEEQYTMTITNIYGVNIRKNANNQTHIDAIHANSENIEVGLKFSDMANYADVETTAVVTVAKCPVEIVWDQDLSTELANQTTISHITGYHPLTATIKDTKHNKDVSSETAATFGFTVSDITEGCTPIVTLNGKLLSVTGNGAGTVTVTASYAESDNFLDATDVEKSFSITKAVPQFNWAVAGNLNATYGDNNVTATTTHDGTGTVTYGSSEPTVATIDGNGNITIVGAGTTTLSATLAADCQYEAVTTAIEKILTVGQATGTINWVTGKEPHDDTYSTTLTEEVEATSNNTDDVSIVYGSSNKDVADFENGVLKIYKAGTTTITATRAATRNFTEAKCSTEIVISKAPCTISITSPATITYGQTEIIEYRTTNTDQNVSVIFTSGNTNIVSISGNQATGAGAGTTYVYAVIAESDNYLQATSDDFNITVGTAQASFTIDDIALTYGDLNHAVIINNGGITDYTVSFNINDGDKSYISINSNNNIDAIGAKCDDQGDLINIPVTADFTSTNYEIPDVQFNVTVAKAVQTITWEEDKNYTVSNMAGSINLSDYCSGTSGGGTITFSSLDTTVAKVSGNYLVIKKITALSTVTITATAEGTANYNEATESRVFTITAENPTLEISQDYLGKTINLASTKTKVSSVTDDVDFAKLLIDEEILICNYESATYTFVSSDTTVATFDENGKIIAYKKADNLAITVTAHVGQMEASTTLHFKIPRGVMKFKNDGNWHENGKWVRTDMLPSADDHDVSIQANCIIQDDSTAVCYNLNITDSGSLSVNPNAVLDVTDTITNSDASKLTLKANENHSATVLFATGSPSATVENYIQGGLHSEGEGKPNNPDWQYRGFVGNNPSLSNWNVVIFKWDEALNSTNCWGESPVYEMSGNYTFSPWDGYCMANYDGEHEREYTSKLIPSDTTMTYHLSYTNNGQQYPNRGVNLITNSWSAPIDMRAVTFGSNVESTFYFYRTRNHNAWEADSTSTFVVYPQNTGHLTASSTMIASSQSFLVKATGAGATLTINSGALAHEANGKMYAPAEKERFNVLSITMSNDTMADRVFLLESENCSRAFDNGYDGTKIKEGNMPQIFASNDFGHTAVNTDKTMLGQRIGYSAAKDGALCTITFNTERLEGFSELYLYDRVARRYANILAGDSYSFTGTKAGEEERFEIVGRRDDGSEFVTSSDMMIEVIGNRALLSGFAGGNDEVFITDMNGKRLWTERASNGPWFELPNLPAGVYLINCGEANCKFIVK